VVPVWSPRPGDSPTSDHAVPRPSMTIRPPDALDTRYTGYQIVGGSHLKMRLQDPNPVIGPPTQW
jgi:hypothetical protein